MSKLSRFLPHLLAAFVAIVFFDSLRFKFTNHPNTQEIFGRLDRWAEGFGAGGLFSQTGLFSQYVIGTAELTASVILIAAAIFPRLRVFQPIGALIGLIVMTGAISFHLFTPLGIDPTGDGGGLFVAACFVWLSNLALLGLRFPEAKELVRRARKSLRPAKAAASEPSPSKVGGTTQTIPTTPSVT